MPTDILQAAVIQSMARNLSVADLIRTVETLRQSGQTKSVETLYSTWIDHNADNPLLYAVLFNYSVVLSDANRLEPARDCLQRAIALNPDFMPAYINLGRVYERQGNAGTALVQWSAALTRMAPVSGQAISYKTTALNQSARALEAANQDQAAEEMLRQSLDIDPHQREAAQHFVALRQRQCEWPILTPWDRVTQRVLINGMSPLSAGAFTDDPILQMAMAWNYNKSDVAEPPAPIATFKPAPGERRLRVGYLSSDLREHAVGYLMAEVLALHDRSKVEVFAYYCGPEAKDPLHLHFKATADHWTSITGLDDATAAKKIAADKIDILVDLNGYTREARVNVIALRPAPVIVNWLGYPGTMGSPYHHYIIADDWIIPPDHELYYSEKVLRLPCYQPNNRKRGVAKRPSRAETGLPDNAFVFCCFNGAHKISRFTFDRWLMIIERVPNSVLWLLSSTEQADKRLREYAAARGIAPERVIFAKNSPTRSTWPAIPWPTCSWTRPPTARIPPARTPSGWACQCSPSPANPSPRASAAAWSARRASQKWCAKPPQNSSSAPSITETTRASSNPSPRNSAPDATRPSYSTPRRWSRASKSFTPKCAAILNPATCQNRT